MAGAEVIPSGTVTFLFTDVQGSTQLWATDPTAMGASLRVHDEVLRRAIEGHGGYVFTTAGDSFCAAFGRASEAVDAARFAQEELRSSEWPGPVLSVRMGLHLGESEERNGDYYGPVVNTAARVEAAGHGGQVVLTEAVRSAAAVEAVDLGEHQLRDVPGKLRLFQLGAEEFPRLRVIDEDVVRLPRPATRLIGREDEIRRVRSLLLDHRMVTLTGVGGSGKTRLAVEIGDRLLPTIRDGVYFADLLKVADPDDVAGAAGAALGLQLEDDDPTERVCRFLAPRHGLLILDNCEHVIDSAADLAEAVLAAPGPGRIIATSREPLGIDGEHVFHVPSLDATGVESPAVRLFIDRAEATGATIERDEETLASITELCEQLDGMPLAIELAAARATIMSPRQLLDRIGDRFALLSGGRRRSRQRQRTLEATITWSYDLLAPDEQVFFRHCGVFDGDFDVPAASAVTRTAEFAALDLISSLTAKSLLEPVDSVDGVRYRLLESLKAYALDKLISHAESEACRDRHAAHYAERWDIVEHNDEANRAMPMMIADRDNLRGALEWAHTRRDASLATRLFATVGWLDVVLNDFHTFKRWYAELDLADDDVHAQWIHMVAVAALNASMDTRTALTVDGPALSSGDDGVRSSALCMRAMLVSSFEPDEATRLIDQALEISGLSPARQAWVHTSSGMALSRAGQLDRARSAFHSSLESSRDAPGFVAILSLTHIGLATIDLLNDLAASALESLDRVEFAPPASSVPVLRAIALGALERGDEALDLLAGEARRAFLGRVPYLACPALIGFAGLDLANDEPDRARHLIRSVRGLGYTGHTAYWLCTADRLGYGPEVRTPDHRPLPEPELHQLLRDELVHWGLTNAP